MKPSILTNNQTKTFHASYTERGQTVNLIATVRHDDQCGNGHNTFSITGQTTIDGRADMGGCIHDVIAKRLPKLAPFIKWHLTSTDGPMHYIANTVYHAGDRDHNGLRAGERKQIRNGKTGKLCWILEADKGLENYVDSDETPAETATLRYVPLCHDGKGKARELDHARSSAVWPEATDAELMAEPEVLKAKLMERHAKLMEEFQAAVESLGFIY